MLSAEGFPNPGWKGLWTDAAAPQASCSDEMQPLSHALFFLCPTSAVPNWGRFKAGGEVPHRPESKGTCVSSTLLLTCSWTAWDQGLSKATLEPWATCQPVSEWTQGRSEARRTGARARFGPAHSSMLQQQCKLSLVSSLPRRVF